MSVTRKEGEDKEGRTMAKRTTKRKTTVVPEKKILVHVRWMIRRDMPEILAMKESPYLERWSEEDFLSHLRQRNEIGMVAELGEKIVGFMVYELRRKSLFIHRLAIHSGYERRAIGSQMVQKLKGKLSSHRRVSLDFRIHERNVGAQLFLKSQGFQSLGIHRGAFGSDDGYDFTYMHRPSEWE